MFQWQGRKMSNDLDLYHDGGELAPYAPSQPLAPSPADYWGYEPDYGTDLTTDQTVPLFDPAHAEVIQQNVGQIAGMFMQDFSALAHNQAHINHSIRWFQQHIGRDFTMPVRRHGYSLYQYSNDAAMQHFANFAHAKGLSAKMVSDICWWVAELEKRLDSTAVDTPAREGTYSSELELTDREWKQLEHINQQAAGRSEDILHRKYGSAYKQVIQTANEYLQGLDTASKKHFDQYTTGGVHALNDATIIDNLYQMAIGANNIPNGAALATEIAEIELFMRQNRSAYNKDQRIQNRLLELYRRRDGG